MENKIYTLTEKLQEVVKQFPDKIAVQIKKDQQYVKYTYNEFYDYVKSIAYSLLKNSVKKGDKIAIILENRPEWCFIYFAILLSGAIAVPIDPQSNQEELRYFFNDSATIIIFTSQQFFTSISQINHDIASLQKIIVLDGLPNSVEDLDVAVATPFAKFFCCPRGDAKLPQLVAEDIASILYTSGTTGKPKGVMLTHKNFYANFRSIEKIKFLAGQHNVLALLPLHHSFPFMSTLLGPLFTHNTITFVATLKQEEILRCMQETGVTMLVGVPQLFSLFSNSIRNKLKEIIFLLRWPLWWLINILWFLRKATKINLTKCLLSKIHRLFGSKLRFFVCGGAKLHGEIELFLNKIGFTLFIGYGLTETAPIDTLNPFAKRKIGSVGKAIPDVDVKIVEPGDDGIGEVVIKGSNVMLGYYKHPVETEQVLKDGWFYTGDLGYFDAEGYLFLTGRKKELIVLSSGKNITPEEVEEHYEQSIAIKELCVLPVVDKVSNMEKLMAVIVPDFAYFRKFSEINFQERIKLELDILAKDYPAYKQIMGFVIAKDDLPRTRLGKLQRFEIKDKYMAELVGKAPREIIAEEVSIEDLQLISSTIFQKVAVLIRKDRCLTKPVNLSDHLGIDLGYDSLSRLELIVLLEKQFNVKIKEAVMAQLSSVRELVLLMDKLIVEQKPRERTVLKIQAKENMWGELLRNDPQQNIIDKIDLNPNWYARFVDILFCGGLFMISKLVWRVEVINANKLPKDTPLILCPNHASYLDAFLIGATIPNWLKLRIFYLGYSVFFEVPIIRDLVKIGRIIPLDSGARLIDAMQACGFVLRHNKAICIFPEGGRSTDGLVKTFKKGVGILAKELNVPLVPVYIDGSFKVLPRGRKLPGLNKIKVIFGDVCYPDELMKKGQALGAQNDYEAIAIGVESEVIQLQQSLSS